MRRGLLIIIVIIFRNNRTNRTTRKIALPKKRYCCRTFVRPLFSDRRAGQKQMQHRTDDRPGYELPNRAPKTTGRHLWTSFPNGIDRPSETIISTGNLRWILPWTTLSVVLFGIFFHSFPPVFSLPGVRRKKISRAAPLAAALVVVRRRAPSCFACKQYRPNCSHDSYYTFFFFFPLRTIVQSSRLQ